MDPPSPRGADAAAANEPLDVEIVSFDPVHLESIVELSLEAWEPVFESLEAALDPEVFDAFYPDWREVQAKAVAEACSSPDNQTWSALLDESPIGFVTTALRDEGTLGEVYMVAVDPRFQGHGVGTRLVEFAVERLRGLGAVVAMVETGGDEGHASARRAYEAAGFGELPIARYFKKL